MARQAMVSYACDGPDCSRQLVCDGDEWIGPESWLVVQNPGPVFEDSHFCGFLCLSMWANQQCMIES